MSEDVRRDLKLAHRESFTKHRTTPLRKDVGNPFRTAVLGTLALALTGPGVAGQEFRDSGQSSLGGGDSSHVGLADLDGDGDKDAIVTDGGDGDSTVYINDGTGTLSSSQSLATGRTSGVALADLDGDGDQDAFFANVGDNGGTANTVYTNDGSGSFSSTNQALGSAKSTAVALADLDGDGDKDAFVTNDADTGNAVYINDGDGSFSRTNQSLGSADSNAVALADLDGDGDKDAFAANGGYLCCRNRVYLNDGSGTFSEAGQPGKQTFSADVVLADLDGDGDKDAFVANLQDTSVRFGDAAANAIYMNDGTGTFGDPSQTTGNEYFSGGVALADVDGDGDKDAFVTNSSSGQDHTVYINDGSGTLDPGQAISEQYSSGVALADLDGDGDKDAFVPRTAQKSESVYINDNAGLLRIGQARYEPGEGDGTVTVEVERVGGINGRAEVEVGTSPDSAVPPSDYTSRTKTVDWANGDSASRTVDIPLTDDSMNEGVETFSVGLSNAADPDGSGAAPTLHDPASATVAIRENDFPPRFADTSPTTLTVTENGSETITLGASDPNGDSLDFSVTTSASHGSVDLSGAAVTYTPDSGYSGNDSFVVRVADGNGMPDTASIAVTVEERDDDGGGGDAESGSTASSDGGGGAAGGMGLFVAWAALAMGCRRRRVGRPGAG